MHNMSYICKHFQKDLNTCLIFQLISFVYGTFSSPVNCFLNAYLYEHSKEIHIYPQSCLSYFIYASLLEELNMQYSDT